MRHKWDGKPYKNSDGYKGGSSVACKRCGCVKEILHGILTYFINDTVYFKAPPCVPISEQEDKRIREQNPDKQIISNNKDLKE